MPKPFSKPPRRQRYATFDGPQAAQLQARLYYARKRRKARSGG